MDNNEIVYTELGVKIEPLEIDEVVIHVDGARIGAWDLRPKRWFRKVQNWVFWLLAPVVVLVVLWLVS